MTIDVFFGTRREPLGGFSEETWNLKRPRWTQIHGTSVCEVKEAGQECGNVDALFTRVPGIPLGVVTADCVPLLLTRDDCRAAGAIHAGWRGTKARILESFFQALPEELSCLQDWRVSIGPAIGPCCYEVGADLILEFQKEFPLIPLSVLEPKNRHLDLRAILAQECARLGLNVDFVHQDCTSCSRDPEGHRYFSYRRGDRNSRQFSLVQIESRPT